MRQGDSGCVNVDLSECLVNAISNLLFFRYFFSPSILRLSISIYLPDPFTPLSIAPCLHLFISYFCPFSLFPPILSFSIYDLSSLHPSRQVTESSTKGVACSGPRTGSGWAKMDDFSRYGMICSNDEGKLQQIIDQTNNCLNKRGV